LQIDTPAKVKNEAAAAVDRSQYIRGIPRGFQNYFAVT
jgi:hypothetical protein